VSSYFDIANGISWIIVRLVLKSVRAETLFQMGAKKRHAVVLVGSSVRGNRRTNDKMMF